VNGGGVFAALMRGGERDARSAAVRRFESRAARLLAALPPRLQVLLSGKPPVRVDGQTLEPELQLSLALLERRGDPPLQSLPLPKARAAFRRRMEVSNGPPVPVGSVRDLTVAGAGGPLAARHYVPEEPGGPRPMIVFFHGGGFVFGDLETHDVPCRLLCRHSGAQVLAVDYRLAPEHPFPAAVEDGRAALRWATGHAAELGADPARVAVAGDSAGGNIAAVAALEAARDGGPAPVLQVLFYPATDMVERAPSRELFGEGFVLDRELMDWFAEQYVAGADPADPRLSVLRAPDLNRAAPALVATAGFDPLRDEGEAYARALRDSGVSPVVLRRFSGLVHGFCSATGTSRASRDALVELAGATRALLEAGREVA
jgi:acetyl esterase